ncbi:MAG: hypothetical protein HQL66_06015 [Magnetococcales bacterium]|nr:hypothetical protein [Magnetococcales bacterium]
MASWDDLPLALGIVSTTALAYGLPLSRGLTPVHAPDPWSLRLGVGFGVGLVPLAILSALMHNVLPLGPQGRTWGAWVVLFLVPIWLLGREAGVALRAPFRPSSRDRPWLPVIGVILLGGVLAFIPFFPYPGSFKFGLGDQVESLALAKSLARGDGYTVPYLIFDFPQRAVDLQSAMQTGRVRIEPIPSRLPFLPLLTALYSHLLPDNPFVLSCILFLTGLAAIPLTAHWIRLCLQYLKISITFTHLDVLTALAFILSLGPVIFVGSIESVTLLFILIAFIILIRWQHHWREAWVLLIALLPLPFIKGEGIVAVALLGTIFLLPLFFLQLRRIGLRGSLPLLTAGLLFLIVALPWIGYVTRHGATAHSALEVFNTAPDGSYHVKTGPFLDILARHYRVEIDPATLTARLPANHDPLPPLDSLLLQLHLQRAKVMQDNVFFYNYMLGVQSLGKTMDLAAFQPEPWSGQIRIVLTQLMRDVGRLLTWLAGWQVALLAGMGVAFLFGWGLLVRSFPGFWLSYTLFFVSCFLLLDAANPAILFLIRFLVLFLPFLLLPVLVAGLRLLQRLETNPLLRHAGTPVVRLTLVALLAWGSFTAAFDVQALRREGGHVADVMRQLRAHTPADARVSSALPQYVGALADRQAIGHADNLLFLPWQATTYRPSHILIFKRPDVPSDEYKLYSHFGGEKFLPDYRPIFNDPELRMIILERKEGRSRLDRARPPA